MKKSLEQRCETTAIANWIPLLAAIKQEGYLIKVNSLTHDKLDMQVSRPQGQQRSFMFVPDYFFVDMVAGSPYQGNTKECINKDLKIIAEMMNLL